MVDDVKNVKVVFLGEPGCGKTSIINRYINGTFNPDQESTIGANYFSKTVEVNSVWIKLNLWDIAGKDRYEGLATLYAKNAEAYVLVCQCTQESAADSIERFYNKYIKENIKKDTQLLVVVNKIDLNTSENSLNLILAKADELHISVFQVSSKDGIGIEDMFQKLQEKIRRNSAAISRRSINLTTSSKHSVNLHDKKKCCSG
jgi:small GTP-binding protein